MAGSNFDSLIAELTAEAEDLAKALPAAEGDAEDGADSAEGDAAEDGDEDADDGKEQMLGKSIKVTDADGNEHEAVDAAPLLKALGDRLDANDTVLAKALDGFAGVIRTQGKMLKSLTAQVSALSAQGRGRKAVVTLHDRKTETPLKKGETDSISTDELLAKSMDAFNAGRITGLEVATVEACINARQQVNPELMRRVIGPAS